MLVTFDAATQSLSFALLGSPTVHFSGPFGAIVESKAKSEVETRLKAQIQNAINQFSGLMTFASQATELTTQLTTLAGPSDVHFDEAIFSSDGMIVRGPVTLVPRRRPVHAFETTVEQDGFTAVGSWIPGGRVDAFDWSWNWFNNGGDPGTETDKDRFILRRPQESNRSRFGVLMGLRRPLPGLDGMGIVCLNVKASRFIQCTGEWVPAATERHCRRFGIELTLTPPGLDRLFMKEFGGKPRDPIGPIAEVAVHRVDGRNPATRSANTLVIFAGEQWNRETASALREGVAACTRSDAGLLVIVLFRDGTITAKGAPFVSELREQLTGLEAPLLINEDVHGSWSRSLYVDAAAGELTYRLVTRPAASRGRTPGPSMRAALARRSTIICCRACALTSRRSGQVRYRGHAFRPSLRDWDSSTFFSRRRVLRRRSAASVSNRSSCSRKKDPRHRTRPSGSLPMSMKEAITTGTLS